MKLATLYKRAKSGAIQQWTVSVQTEEDQEDTLVAVYVVKEQGQVGGKLQTYKEEIKQGKNLGKANETTPYEQAVLEANSDWRRKLDEGYKSLEQLGIEIVSV